MTSLRFRTRVVAPIAAWVERRTDRWRCPTVDANGPILARSGDEFLISVGTRRRFRYGYELRFGLDDAAALNEIVTHHLGALIAEGRQWRVRTGREPAPRHAGDNAEDCPACQLLPSDQIPYPWLCPGRDEETHA